MKTLAVNRNVIVSIFAVMMLIYGVQGISYGLDAPDTIVEFKDINLAKGVRQALNLPIGDNVDILKIPKSELAKLTELDLETQRVAVAVTDLTGLEHATQLTLLNLNGYWREHNVSDLTPLAQLTQLRTLDLFSNNISDLTPLAQLIQLTDLNLARNKISDITPLAQLTQLRTLDLSSKSNKISDITPLAQLTQLTTLNLGSSDIYDNYFSDLTPLAHLKHLGSISAVGFSGAASEIPLIGVSAAHPLVEATLNGSSVVLTLLRDGTAYDVSTDNIRNVLTVSGIDGVSVSDITRMSDTEVEAVLGFTGNFDAITMLTFTLEAEAVSGFDARALTGKIRVYPEGGPTITASTARPLTGATLNEAEVELTISNAIFIAGDWIEDDAITVSGIPGISIKGWKGHGPRRSSPTTKLTIELGFIGFNDDIIAPDVILTLTVEFGAIVDYNGPPLTAQIPVKGVTEAPRAMVASTPYPLKEAMLDGTIVTLTLSGGTFSPFLDLEDDLTISGITGITFRRMLKDSITRETQRRIRLYFNGDINEDTVLTFTLHADAISGYNGPAFTAELPVTATVKGLRVLIPELQQQPMFWVNTNTGKIETTEPFDAVTNGVTVLTVDRAGGKLYWGERSKSGGIIKRANFDGTNVEVLVTLSSVPRGIVVDAMKNKMYWTNSDSQIQTANLDGKDISTVIQLPEDVGEKIEISCDSGGLLFLIFGLGGGCSEVTIPINLTSPTDIDLNTVDGRLYWTEFSGRIRRVNLDGTGLGTLVPDIGSPYGIVVASDKVYWAEEIDERHGKIQRANFNGTNIETLATVHGHPTGISVDTVAGKVYWANSLLGEIQRTDINGGEVEVVVSGIIAPGDFVLVPDAQPTTPTTVTTNARVNISPASVASPAVGEQITFNLNIAGGEAVAGYQATVQFDETALRYVEGINGDYLRDTAFFAPPTVDGNRVTLNATSLAGETKGDGTLAILTFDVVSAKASTLTLSEVHLVNSAGEKTRPKVENAQITEPALDALDADVNGDGSVDVQDLVMVQARLGQTGPNSADVNGDGIVDIADLVLVAGAMRNGAAAPSLYSQFLGEFIVADVKLWLSQAQRLDLTDPRVRRGVLFLEQLLAVLLPKETTLLPNYPNPFNPETWIPYRLAEDAFVTLTIYDSTGRVVRTLEVGHRVAAFYESRSKAIYWDGRNEFGEQVGSGVYFYHLSAGNYSATRKMLILK